HHLIGTKEDIVDSLAAIYSDENPCVFLNELVDVSHTNNRRHEKYEELVRVVSNKTHCIPFDDIYGYVIENVFPEVDINSAEKALDEIYNRLSQVCYRMSGTH